jgi:3',5'-cyclic AMP phosphodiesterase CpdA
MSRLPGFGDEKTWPAPSGNPADPRTPDNSVGIDDLSDRLYEEAINYPDIIADYILESTAKDSELTELIRALVVLAAYGDRWGAGPVATAFRDFVRSRARAKAEHMVATGDLTDL